jgi:hypothetical protein
MARKSKPFSFEIGDGCIVTVDKCDSDLADYYWEAHHTHGNIYARRRNKENGRSWIRMHRVVLERKLGRPITDGKVPDHIDRNTLDNQRANLREVTQMENLQNRRAAHCNISGIKGVTWHKRDKVWQAQVTYDGEYHYLGRFKSKDMAYLAVYKKRKQLGVLDHQ